MTKVLLEYTPKEVQFDKVCQNRKEQIIKMLKKDDYLYSKSILDKPLHDKVDFDVRQALR